MRKQVALGSVLAFGLASQVMAAEGFSYSNVDVSYVHGSSNNLDGGEGIVSDKGNGFSLAGSVALGEHFFGFANYTTVKFKGDAGATSVSLKPVPMSFGAGYHWALSPSMDLVTGLSYEHLKVKLSATGLGSTSASDSGYGISAGLRGRLADKFEWTAGLKYQDVGDFGSGLGFNAGGRYYFTDSLAAGIDYNHSKYKDADAKFNTLSVSLRYDFGM